MVEYTYGAWGDILSVSGTLADTIGQKNPLRYRGYYYDAETGFYLTGTRYYDPEIGRFINADGCVSTGQGILGYNMFAYCENNPVNCADPSGMTPYRLFNTADEAALNFAKYYNAKSIKAKQEYGSTIYRYTYTETRSSVEKIEFNILGIPITIRFLVTTDVLISKYYYNTPCVGNDGESVVPNLLGVGIPVSTVHTHANYNPIYNNENFSQKSSKNEAWGDIDWYNFFRMNGYLATPGGYFKKYTYKNRNDANGGITIISDAIPWDPNSPNH